MLNCRNFPKKFPCDIQSLEIVAFETETRKNESRDESRDRDQVSRLHHCQKPFLSDDIDAYKVFVDFKI